MTDTLYNGWTNYATWRINLEIFDGMEWDCEVDADMLKDFVDECVIDTAQEGLVRDYAAAFISEVNWHEIARSINEE